jgi:hypothetical protein
MGFMGFFDLFRSKREEQVVQLAKQLGYKYQEKDEFGLLNLLSDFKLMQIGSRRRIKNILSNDDLTADLKIRIFDFRYTISSGQASQRYSQSVFFVQSKELGLPRFYLQPEHFFHRVKSWIGMNDIDFDHHPDFSRTYHLNGDDEYLIRTTFSNKVLDYFSREQGWHAEGLNYFLIIYRAKELLPPDSLPAFGLKGMEVYRIFRGEGFSV